ncbi:MAG: tetratricopeptide repeat protein [Candidatus Brocadiae bacterium]|nr:tetratricopeptide repeat protein [Candidatus Brocadiia bacterium]
MPSTINGIGTHYYGKKNLEKQRGVCEHCGAAVELQTYETRLWFVVLFIPIIPLGRKQILDKCPKCSWHRALPVSEWERVREESIQKTASKASELPDDPQAAMELHATLVSFRQKEQAEQIAQVLDARFGDRADVQMHLGAWHEERGDDEKADACFARALELEPDNQAARRAVGIAAMQQGDLARAHELLGFMMHEGDDQDPAVLFLLANAHQERGEHEEALRLYGVALHAAPEIAKQKAFRQRVEASEKALAKPQTMLPKKPLSWRRWAWAGILLFAVVGFFAFNRYKGNRQTLHIVNRLGTAVTVQMDGETWTVRAGEHKAATVAEGDHTAEVSANGQTIDTVKVAIHNGFFERFNDDNVFVLNPRGAAVLLWEQITYSAKPVAFQPPRRVLHSQSFFVIRDVDHAFRSAPETLKVESSSKQIKRTVVTQFNGTPFEAFALFPGGTPMDEYRRFAEHQLGLHPDDGKLVRAYFAIASTPALTTICVAFLEKGLDRRPVNTDWHRYYQEARKANGEREQLLALYTEMLAKEPRSSSLLYLKGRLIEDTAESGKLFDQAITANDRNPYPWFAKAYHLHQQGDFAAARTACTHATRLQPDNPEMQALLGEIRLATGDVDALLAETNKALRDAPLNFAQHHRALQLLVAKGNGKAALDAHNRFAKAVKEKMPGDPQQFALLSRMALHTLQGECAAALPLAAKLRNKALARVSGFNLHVELGQLAAAAKLVGEEPTANQCLILHVAHLAKGNAAQAKAWRDKAIPLYKKGGGQERRVAAFLAKGNGITDKDMANFEAPFPDKLPALVAAAAACPAQRDKLLALAEKLNVGIHFPHRFIQSAIAAARKKGTP